MANNFFDLPCLGGSPTSSHKPSTQNRPSQSDVSFEAIASQIENRQLPSDLPYAPDCSAGHPEVLPSSSADFDGSSIAATFVETPSTDSSTEAFATELTNPDVNGPHSQDQPIGFPDADNSAARNLSEIDEVFPPTILVQLSQRSAVPETKTMQWKSDTGIDPEAVNLEQVADELLDPSFQVQTTLQDRNPLGADSSNLSESGTMAGFEYDTATQATVSESPLDDSGNPAFQPAIEFSGSPALKQPDSLSTPIESAPQANAQSAAKKTQTNPSSDSNSAAQHENSLNTSNAVASDPNSIVQSSTSSNEAVRDPESTASMQPSLGSAVQETDGVGAANELTGQSETPLAARSTAQAAPSIGTETPLANASKTLEKNSDAVDGAQEAEIHGTNGDRTEHSGLPKRNNALGNSPSSTVLGRDQKVDVAVASVEPQTSELQQVPEPIPQKSSAEAGSATSDRTATELSPPAWSVPGNRSTAAVDESEEFDEPLTKSERSKDADSAGNDTDLTEPVDAGQSLDATNKGTAKFRIETPHSGSLSHSHFQATDAPWSDSPSQPASEAVQPNPQVDLQLNPTEDIAETLVDAMVAEDSFGELQGELNVKRNSDAIRDAAITSLDASGKTVQIELHPAELGSLKIQVSQVDQSVEAQIVASEFVTSELLLNHRETLMETLADLGFESSEVNISFEDKHSLGTQRDAESGDRGQNKRESNSAYRRVQSPQSANAQTPDSPGGLNIIA